MVTPTQLGFGFADPAPAERTTLAPAPTAPYVAPRLQPKPLSLFDMFKLYEERRKKDAEARLWLREVFGIELSEDTL